MTPVAKGEVSGFSAAARPDRAVLFDLHSPRRFAGSLMGTIAEGRAFRLSAGTEIEGLPGLGVDFVRGGLPAHGFII